MRRRVCYVSVIFLSILISCSTETGVDPVDNSNPVKASYSSISTQIFDLRCSCHLDGQSPALKSSEAYGNLVGIKNAAGTQSFIEPGQPNNSYLFQKIIENGNRTGARMPRTGPPFLSQVEIDSIRAWIENGALNN
jgi:hypothetical protein